MAMKPTDFDGAVPVDGYGPGFFRVGNEVIQGPVLVTPRGGRAWGGSNPSPAVTSRDTASLRNSYQGLDNYGGPTLGFSISTKSTKGKGPRGGGRRGGEGSTAGAARDSSLTGNSAGANVGASGG